jgi:hypothetical protein
VFDQFTTARFVNAALAEGATATDEYPVRVIFAATVAEAVAALDSYVPVREINARVTGVQLYINIGNVLIWATVNDDQNANWQVITNTQSGGWTVVNDTQNPGWTHIPS